MIKIISKHIAMVMAFAAMALTLPVLGMAEGGDEDEARYAPILLRHLHQSKLTMPRLVEVAEEAGKGKAIGLEVETDNSGLEVEVTLLRGKEVLRVSCSPVTGEVVKVGKPEMMNSAVARMSEDYEWVNKAKMSLGQAITLAEADGQSTTLEAQVEEREGWAGYEMKVLSFGELFSVIVDPETGRIVSRRVVGKHD